MVCGCYCDLSHTMHPVWLKFRTEGLEVCYIQDSERLKWRCLATDKLIDTTASWNESVFMSRVDRVQSVANFAILLFNSSFHWQSRRLSLVSCLSAFNIACLLVVYSSRHVTGKPEVPPYCLRVNHTSVVQCRQVGRASKRQFLLHVVWPTLPMVARVKSSQPIVL